MGDKEIILSAQVILFAADGKSIGDEQIITTKNIRLFTPPAENIEKAAAILQQAGFSCRLSTPTLSISGTQLLFEGFFKMKLGIKNHALSSYTVVLQKAVIPARLKQLVKDIVFGEPMETFQ